MEQSRRFDGLSSRKCFLSSVDCFALFIQKKEEGNEKAMGRQEFLISRIRVLDRGRFADWLVRARRSGERFAFGVDLCS